MKYRIEEIEGIGDTYADKLATAGIKNTGDFLTSCCSAKGRKTTSQSTGVSEKLLLKWANMADLMRISGIGKQFAELLEAAGVDTIKELRHRKADHLAAKMKEVNQQKRLTRLAPGVQTVERWIEQAKALEPTITH